MYPKSADPAFPGVAVEASEDYRGPGLYDISHAELGIPEVDGDSTLLFFQMTKGITSLDALLVSEDIGRRCVSGNVELYPREEYSKEEFSKLGISTEVPGTLEFDGVCGEFVEF